MKLVCVDIAETKGEKVRPKNKLHLYAKTTKMKGIFVHKKGSLWAVE